MAADLGGSQISALLESVPGIRNVLRSPVADALVNMIRSAAGLRPFEFGDVEELVQYAVRRGLINQSEGEQVIEDVRGIGPRRGKAKGGGKTKAPARPKARPAAKKPHAAKPVTARRPVKKH